MPFPLAAVIGAAGSIAGGIGSALIGNSGTRQNMQLQAKLNKEQLSYQDALNRNYQNMLWSKQYQAQMSGMKNAGLNPALANGTSVGGATASNSLSAGPTGPSGAMPSIDPVSGAVSAMNAEKDMTIKDKQAELIDAQTKETLSRAEKNTEEAEFVRFQNSPSYKAARLSGASNESLRAFWDAMKSQSDIKVNDQSVIKMAKETEKIAEEVGLVGEQKKNYIAATAKLYKECAFIAAQTKTETFKQAWYSATSRAANAAASLDEQRRHYDLPWYEKEEKLQHALSEQESTKGQAISNQYEPIRRELETKLQAYFTEVQLKYNLDARAYWNIVSHIMHSLSPVSDVAPVGQAR